MLHLAWASTHHDARKERLGKTALRALIEGDRPVIKLSNLFDAAEISDGLLKVIEKRPTADVTQYNNGSLTLLGTFLVKNLGRLDSYFDEAADIERRFKQWDFNMASTARERLRDLFGLDSFEVASQTSGRRFASSNVRICSNNVDTPLHNDFVMRDAQGYDVVLKHLAYQLSCVICLQGPEEGGELTVYRKKWELADEKYKVSGGLGYDLGVVEGRDAYSMRPKTGDVYLLNPTYYHAVERVSGRERITLGFFFGFFDEELKDAVAWV